MKNDFVLCLKLNPSLNVTIKRIKDHGYWKPWKKIPILNSVCYDFIGNRYPYHGLPKLYAALTHFTGPGDRWYDDYKGSYSFTFELVVEKNCVTSRYCYHITHYRSYIDFSIYQIVSDTDPRNTSSMVEPNNDLFSEKDMLYFSNCFYHCLLKNMEEENYVPEPFVKFSQSNLLIFGYSDKLKDYFIEQYDDEEKFNKEIKTKENKLDWKERDGFTESRIMEAI